MNHNNIDDGSAGQMSNPDVRIEGDAQAEATGRPFIAEVWSVTRPYLVRLVSDWLIATTLWVLLWLFKRITTLWPVEGWAGEFMVNLHAAGTVMALALFVGLLLLDIIQIRRNSG
jgi:hypothetical protein